MAKSFRCISVDPFHEDLLDPNSFSFSQTSPSETIFERRRRRDARRAEEEEEVSVLITILSQFSE